MEDTGENTHTTHNPDTEVYTSQSGKPRSHSGIFRGLLAGGMIAAGVTGCFGGDGFSCTKKPTEVDKAAEAVKGASGLVDRAKVVVEEVVGIKQEFEEEAKVIKEKQAVQDEKFDEQRQRIDEAESRFRSVASSVGGFEDEQENLKVEIEGVGRNVDRFNTTLDDFNASLGGLERRFGDVESKTEELDKKIALPTSGIVYKYENGYSLERRNLDPKGREERVVLKNRDGKPLQIINIRYFKKGDEKEFDLINRVWRDMDRDRDGELDHDRKIGGFYIANDAEKEFVKLGTVINDLKRANKSKIKSEFEEALMRLRSIGNNPTYPLLEEKAEEVLELFEFAGKRGTYIADDAVLLPGKHMGREKVSIKRSEEGNEYSVYAGEELLETVAIAKERVRRRLARLDVNDLTANQEHELVIPNQYVVEMVDAWAKGNQRGKDAYTTKLEEEEKKAKEEKERKVKEERERIIREAKEKSDATIKEATEKRRGNLIKDYNRGIQLKGTYVDEKNHSEELRLSFGGEQSNYTLHVSNSPAESVTEQETANGNAMSLLLSSDFRCGKVESESEKDERARFRVDLFGQGSSRTAEKGETEPVVSIDDTGRFETTEQYLGGTEEQRESFFSVGLNTEWNNKSFLKILGYGGSEELDWDEDYSVNIVDLTGILPDISRLIDIEGEAKTSRLGVEIITGIGITTNNMIVPLVSYEIGKIEIDDGTTVTEKDFSELRLGAFYRQQGGNWRVTAGGVWAPADVGDESYNGYDLSIALPFATNGYVTVAPSAGLNISDDSSLWRGGLLLTAGGKEGKKADNVKVIDNYLFENFLEDHSRQFTPEAKDMLKDWRFYDLVRNSDANLVLEILGGQQYDSDGDKGFAGRARLALMSSHDKGGKFVLDGIYEFGIEGTKWDAGLGCFGSKGFIRGGYGKLNGKDQFSLALGVNF